jgi:hypothetical protein
VGNDIDLEMKVKTITVCDSDLFLPPYLLAEASRTRPHLIGKKSKMRKEKCGNSISFF